MFALTMLFLWYLLGVVLAFGLIWYDGDNILYKDIPGLLTIGIFGPLLFLICLMIIVAEMFGTRKDNIFLHGRNKGKD
jgi:hypothetical protein